MPTPTSRERWIGRCLLALALLVCLRFSYLNRFFELDDALIYQRFVRNLLQGHGLVDNPGETYNALTSPQFTYLSIAAAWQMGDVGRGGVALAVCFWQLVIASVVLLIGCSWWLTERQVANCRVTPVYRSIGQWIRQNSATETRLAAAEIGTLGWHSRLPIIDMLGLVTPHRSAFLAQRDFSAWLENSAADAVLVHDPPWPIEAGGARGRCSGSFCPRRSICLHWLSALPQHRHGGWRGHW